MKSSLCKRLAILVLVRFGHGELEHVVNKYNDNKVRIDKEAGQTTQNSIAQNKSFDFFLLLLPSSSL